MIYNLLAYMVINAIFSFPVAGLSSFLWFADSLDPDFSRTLEHATFVGIIAIFGMAIAFYLVPSFLPKKLYSIKEQDRFLIINFIFITVLSSAILLFFFTVDQSVFLPYFTNSLFCLPQLFSTIYGDETLTFNGLSSFLNMGGIMALFIFENTIKTIALKIGFNHENNVRYKVRNNNVR